MYQPARTEIFLFTVFEKRLKSLLLHLKTRKDSYDDCTCALITSPEGVSLSMVGAGLKKQLVPALIGIWYSSQ